MHEGGYIDTGDSVGRNHYGTDGGTDGWTEGRTDGPIDRRTDGRTTDAAISLQEFFSGE